MKLIASDYDGTFCTTPEQLKRNIEAALAWQQAGNTFGIVTGRSLEMIQAALRLHHISADFLACNNGASIYDGSGNLLDTATIKSGRIEELLKLDEMQKSFHHIFITSGGSFVKRLSPLSWAEDREFHLSLVEEYKEVSRLPLIQISTCFQTHAEAAACAEAVNRFFSEDVYANLNQDCVDIAPKGINKREGIMHLLELLPDHYEEILVIGDGENDLPMIKHFAGAAVSTAPANVKKEAGTVYGSVEAMIYKFL